MLYTVPVCIQDPSITYRHIGILHSPYDRRIDAPH